MDSSIVTCSSFRTLLQTVYRPFLLQKVSHFWSRHCMFQHSTLSISLRIAALCCLVSCCCRVLSVGEVPLDLTYYWSDHCWQWLWDQSLRSFLWPVCAIPEISHSVSLSPSVIHHVISAHTSSRLVTSYKYDFYILQFPITNTLNIIHVMVQKYHNKTYTDWSYNLGSNFQRYAHRDKNITSQKCLSQCRLLHLRCCQCHYD